MLVCELQIMTLQLENYSMLTHKNQEVLHGKYYTCYTSVGKRISNYNLTQLLLTLES